VEEEKGEAMIDVDAAALLQDITRLPDRMRVRFLRESRTTAERLEREMQSRLQRQLSPSATGQTVQSITHRLAHDGNGYVVLTERNPFPNLPLWLEKGTQPGKRKNFARTQRRPFFYASIELEAPGHERRIADAWNDLSMELGR
jgi:hypothetical protein